MWGMDMRFGAILTVLLLIIISILAAVSIPSDGLTELPETRYDPHDAIYIDGNSDLLNQDLVEGWPGDGSEGDPITISNYVIDANGTTRGIYVNNTDLHLVISGNLIYEAYDGSGRDGEGIMLKYVSNCTVRNNVVRDSYRTGIYLWYCRDINVDGNEIRDTGESFGMISLDSEGISFMNNKVTGSNNVGVSAMRSADVLFQGNNISGMEEDGLRLHTSQNVVSKENRISHCGNYGINVMVPLGNSFFHSNELIGCTLNNDRDFEYLNVPDNNTIDGKPIYLYKYQDDVSVPEDAGMIIGFRTSEMTISDTELPGYRGAVTLEECDSIEIENLTLRDGKSSLILDLCDSVTIKNSTFNNISTQIIALYSTNEVEIAGCDFSEEPTGGFRNIFFSGGSGLKFHNNTVENIDRPLGCMHASGVRIEDNIFRGNIRYPVFMSSVSEHWILRNEMEREGETDGAGVLISGSEEGNIEDNVIRNFNEGVSLSYISGGSVRGNLIEGCGKGIDSYHGSRVEVERNLIYGSEDYGVFLNQSEGCRVIHNSLIGNRNSTSTYNPLKIQAYDNEIDNNWNGSRKGNFWSDWTGPDSDDDGIVDSPYTIKGEENYDNHPLTRSPVVLVSEPVNFTAKAGNGFVSLSWADPENNLADEVLGFRILRESNCSLEIEQIDLGAEVHSHNDSEVENGMDYNYTILALNKYGEGELSDPVSAVPDGASPMVEIIEPRGDFIGSNLLTVTWNSTDDIGISYHSIRVDSGNWTDVGMNRSAELDLSEGEHTIEVYAWDLIGNRGEASKIIRVDTVPPVLTIDPSDGGFLSSDSLTLNWTATDESGIAHFELFLDDESLNDSIEDDFYTIGVLEEGQHTVAVTCFDYAGNMGSDTVEVHVDITQPVVVINSPSEGHRTLERDLTINWVIVETGSGRSSTEVRLDDDEWIALSDPDINSYQFEDLPLGEHIFTVRSTDNAGNIGQDLITITIFEEEIPPATSTVTGRVMDENGDPLRGVKVRSDTGVETTTDSDGYYTFELESGKHLVTFEKEGYDSWERWVDVPENGSVEMGDINLREKEEERSTWHLWCGGCCLASVGVILLLMLIGWISRRRKARKRLYSREE